MEEGFFKITVEKTHTDSMVKAEVLAMLNEGAINLTLGMVARLWLIDSPYIKGGKVESEDVIKAAEIIPHGELDLLAFHNALIDALNTAWRAYEIIVPDDENKPTKVSEFDTFSPEWIADVIAGACHAMPSLTYNQILWEVPLTMILHLGVSTARSNGTLTRRPDDTVEALRQLRAINAKRKREKINE